MSEKLYQLALSLIKGISSNKWKNLISKFHSAESVFKLSKNDLLEILKDDKICDDILNKVTVGEAENILIKHQKEGVDIISYFDNDYPFRLKEIYDAPSFLYCKGANILNKQRVLSVIGTRSPTCYGINNCKNFVNDLGTYNVIIVSGLAYGIDVIAHQEALNNNILTLAVLAGGVDMIYPSAHKNIYDKIIEKGGCIISEFCNGTKNERFRFPLRNRIIAGLSDGILVVEAGEKSGTEITAFCGNEYNRDVFAIPGNINSSKSFGCNKLIKLNKAILVTKAQDIVDELNWNKTKDVSKNVDLSLNLDNNSLEVLNLIRRSKNITFDEIYEELDMDSNDISAILLNLEMNNFVKLLPGDKYCI